MPRALNEALNDDAQKMVASLILYFERERDNDDPLLPLNAMREISKGMAAAVKAGSRRSEYPEPLAIFRAGDDECSIHFAEETEISKIVFDGDRFLYNNKKKFRFVENERHQVDDGLAVLEILCGATPKTTLDRPEFVDIDKLSEFTEKTASPAIRQCDVLELSDDDDDDVVFVAEYQGREGEGRTQEAMVIADSDDSKGSDSRIRRNPVRKARSKAKGQAKDELFEEDFAFLDASEEEAEKKENKPPEPMPSTSKALPKEWPVNVYERPQYNPLTKKIESFDCKIREVKRKGVAKKPKLEAVPAKKKPARQTTKRKRKSAPVAKVPIEELKPLVNSTTDMLKGYFVNSKKQKDMTGCQSDICSFENKLEVLKNQALLFSIVNNLDENEVMEKFKLLNVENDAKDSTRGSPR